MTPRSKDPPTIRWGTIPIQGQVARWAREIRGIDRPDAAKRLAISEAELEAVEDGHIDILAKLLRKMASVYKQTESVLLLPTPPPVLAPPENFRTVRGRHVEPSPEVLLAVREVRRIQRAISELQRVDPSLVATADIAHSALSDEADSTAVAERKRLGVRRDIPSAKSAADAYYAWRSLLQGHGILVFQKKIPRTDCLGFSLMDEGQIPSIVVSTGRTRPEARSFTLFHEYAHLLLRRPGISDQRVVDGPHKRIERWCNEFAAAFLIPRQALKDELGRRFPDLDPSSWDLNHISRMAAVFKVSRTAMGIRLKQCEITRAIDRYEALLRGSDQTPEPAQSQARKQEGRAFGKQRFHEIGPESADVVLEALDSGTIDVIDAVAMLDLSVGQLNGFAKEATSGRGRTSTE